MIGLYMSEAWKKKEEEAGVSGRCSHKMLLRELGLLNIVAKILDNRPYRER